MSIPETRRQQILDELGTRAATIQMANGYSTDAGLNVFFGETPELGQDDPDSAIAIVVGDDRTTDQGETVYTELPVSLQALVKVTTVDAWLVVERILADIKRAIEGTDRTLGGLLTVKLRRGQARTLRREPGSNIVGVALTYVPQYLEAYGTPETE